MTKRRPSWSKQWRRAAALFGGLLLLHGAAPAWAAGHQKPSARPAAARKAVRPVRPAAPEVVQAEVRPADLTGLHGHASFYSQGFQGRKTSSGERFDVRQFTAASNHFPLGTLVAVRRLDSDLCAIVKINDRMHTKHRRRIVDVSHGVAEYLDMIRPGVVLVRLAALKADWAEQGASACHAAFEPDPPCVDCARAPRLPDFGVAAERGPAPP